MSVPAAGTVLGKKYRVIAAIGEGAMGTVLRAENVDTGKKVALKWMHPHIAADPGSSMRLRREAQAASRLSHPNVVDIYDIVQEGKTLFLVMELLQGQTLRAYLQRNRQPKISEFIALLLPALAGVAAAHDEGVIHRDLKPDNIFLVNTPGAQMPTAKVVDFGVAKLDGDQGLTLTGTGFAVGTPMYMSLEQLSGDKLIDARADVYAFGVMLYEAIAGQLPYSANTLSSLAIKVLTTQPVPLKELRPDVPTALARIVDWAIAKRREDRLPSVRALMQELEIFARELSFRQEMTNQGVATPVLALERRAIGGDSAVAEVRSTVSMVAAPARSRPAALVAGRAEEHANKTVPYDQFDTPPAAAVARTLAPNKAGKRKSLLWLGVGTLTVGLAAAGFGWTSRTQPLAAPVRRSDTVVTTSAEPPGEPQAAQGTGLATALPAVERDAGSSESLASKPQSEPVDAAVATDAPAVDGGSRRPKPFPRKTALRELGF